MGKKLNIEQERRDWYILWSKTDCRISKIELVLKGMDAELWIPCYSQIVGQEKEAVPLYPGYYFVNCSRNMVDKIEERIIGLRSRKTLVFMKNEDKNPYTLTVEEISRIKSVEEKEIDNATYIQGDKVRIIAGPLKECYGKVVDVKNGFIKLSTKIFNRDIDAIWIKNSDCEKI